MQLGNHAYQHVIIQFIKCSGTGMFLAMDEASPETTIETARLRLRPHSESDLADLLKLAGSRMYASYTRQESPAPSPSR